MALRELTADGGIGREWTYADLLADAEKLGRALASRHGRGARIAIFAHNLPEWILMELAAGLAGLTMVTVNPAFNARELRYVLEQSGAEAVYFVPSVRGSALGPIVEEASDGLAAVKHHILLTDHDALFDGHDKGALRETTPDDVVQIQYTSGTTGFPKGALLHQKGLIQNAPRHFRSLECRSRREDHIDGPVVPHRGLRDRHLRQPGDGRYDPARARLRSADDRPCRRARTPRPPRRRADDAGRAARCRRSDGRRRQIGQELPVRRIGWLRPSWRGGRAKVFDAPVQIVYGQTEASPGITYGWPDDSEADMTGTIGQPLPHMDVAILDPADGRICDIGEQGEICSRGL